MKSRRFTKPNSKFRNENSVRREWIIFYRYFTLQLQIFFLKNRNSFLKLVYFFKIKNLFPSPFHWLKNKR